MLAKGKIKVPFRAEHDQYSLDFVPLWDLLTLSLGVVDSKQTTYHEMF